MYSFRYLGHTNTISSSMMTFSVKSEICSWELIHLCNGLLQCTRWKYCCSECTVFVCMMHTYGPVTMLVVCLIIMSYNKCIKRVFGFKRTDSMTQVLLEVGLPSFKTNRLINTTIYSLYRLLVPVTTVEVRWRCIREWWTHNNPHSRSTGA